MPVTPFTLRLCCAAALWLLSSAAGAQWSTLAGPPGSGRFGSSVTILPNGNRVIADFSFRPPDAPDSLTCAVHLYSASGVRISTLTGPSAGRGGVTVLSNGNYVVLSSAWTEGAVYYSGAATWCSGERGLNGAVSVENSLMDSTPRTDRSPTPSPGGGVTALSNGNYVVRTPNWSNGALTGAGAVTWCDGTAGRSGFISAANSLVGTAQDDQLGSSAGNGGVTPLESGDYVVSCPFWDNGEIRNAGAVVWCPGNAGRAGYLSAENSLTGAAAESLVGGSRLPARTVVELEGGSFVVCSPDWPNGGIKGAGAVTWCAAGRGTAGAVSAASSLVGTKEGDRVGGAWGERGGGVTALRGGAYAVASVCWDSGELKDAGAVTWCPGEGGLSGPVTAANDIAGKTRT